MEVICSLNAQYVVPVHSVHHIPVPVGCVCIVCTVYCVWGCISLHDTLHAHVIAARQVLVLVTGITSFHGECIGTLLLASGNT